MPLKRLLPGEVVIILQAALKSPKGCEFDIPNLEFINKSVHSSEKSCLSHKLFVTLSSMAVLCQKGRSRVNRCFM